MTARILVVDDTPANIQMLASILGTSGYQVSVATSGRQALDLMARTPPDLVLLDIMMPEMDGFATIREIKANDAWRDLPVIFLTGRSDSSDIVQGFELGAVDYVAKPFNPPELLARVNTHLTMHQLRVTLAEKNQALAHAHEIVRQAFGRYVSEEVATAVLSSPEALELGGSEREVTILMGDLRGFTSMAAQRPPEEVIASLNLYLETMLEVIGRFGGMVDEIIGDAVLVIFGAPIACEDHADRAVACGLAMQLAMAEINERLAGMNALELQMGIGVNTGRVVVGNIGSARRMKYAAVGANVNLAGRIESFTTGGQLLISEMTRDCVQAELRVDAEFRVEPKGVGETLTLLEIGAVGAPYNLALPQRSSDVRVLAHPIDVRFTALEEKFVGRTAHEAQLVALSESDAVLETAVAVLPLSNIAIGLPSAAQVYAKVTAISGNGRFRVHVRFTSLRADVVTWVSGLSVGP